MSYLFEETFMAASPSPSRQPSPFGAVDPTPAAPSSSTSAVAVPPHESRSKLVVGARVVSPRRSFPSLPPPATSSTNSLSVASAASLATAPAKPATHLHQQSI